MSVDFLDTGTVVKALPLMGSAILLVGVLTVPLLCDNFGLFSSLDDVDKEGEFECCKDGPLSTTGLEVATAAKTKKISIILMMEKLTQYCISNSSYVKGII